MEQLQKLSVKIADEEQYNAVTEVMRSMGYEPDPVPMWSDFNQRWSTGDLRVLTTEDGYGIYSIDAGDEFTRYTYDEFISKYQPLTKPLTIGEIHQLRELLKAHVEAKPVQPEPQLEPTSETYSGVFRFSFDSISCVYYGGALLWMSKIARWVVGARITANALDTHTLIEAPHQVGGFYLLIGKRDPKEPTSYGLYDGQVFWRWTKEGEVVRTESATNLKAVKA
jgi:hypothetical protein